MKEVKLNDKVLYRFNGEFLGRREVNATVSRLFTNGKDEQFIELIVEWGVPQVSIVPQLGGEERKLVARYLLTRKEFDEQCLYQI